MRELAKRSLHFLLREKSVSTALYKRTAYKPSVGFGGALLRFYSGYRNVTDPVEQSFIYHDAIVLSHDSVTTVPDMINCACASLSAEMMISAAIFIQKAEKFDEQGEYKREIACLKNQLSNPDSERHYYAFEPVTSGP